ncbi:DUF2157 domain-containing protein [Marinilabiliaceae bacterium JC017]|nr:DUF2157 domain-containing protein [Marinilabiliaceae bacterium JC017]
MKKQLLKDLPELEQEAVITADVAEAIRSYYARKESHSNNRLLTIFGVLGACLVGLGIILIIAHNWDSLPRLVKTTLAFLPLLTGQGIGLFALLKKNDQAPWRESSATFLFFSIGACISLVSQIYNIPGNLGSFLLTWTLLSLPIIYLLRSSMVSLLYIIGITWLVGETDYWSHSAVSVHLYWPLLAAIIPHYLGLMRQRPEGNFTNFHHWFIILSIIFSLRSIASHINDWLFPAYMSLFGTIYLLGQLPSFSSVKRRNNAYLVLGSFGTIVLLLTLSFDWIWKDIADQSHSLGLLIRTPDFFISLLLTAIGTSLYIFKMQRNREQKLNPLELIFMAFMLLFIIGHYSPVIPQVMINLLVLVIGLFYIRYGTNNNHLGILNYGLLTITTLVICRFFDTNISFVMRGLLFIVVGTGFFFANYKMLQKRKTNA